MRIVVSGATGNTGVVVVETLSKLGHEVIALSRTPSSDVSKRLASLPNVTVVLNEEAFSKPVDRIYVCFPPTRTLFVDETEFLRQAYQAKVKYIVKLATAESFMKDPLDKRFYARSHIAIEHILEQGNIPWTSIRANLFFNWVGVDWQEVKKTKKFSSAIGNAPAACIYPGDIGRAAAALLALPDPSAHYGKRYNLSGPADINADSIASDLSEVLHEKITFDHAFTEDEYVAVFVQFGLKPSEAEPMRGTMTEFQSGSLQLKAAPTSPEILALAPPTTTFKQFLQELYATK
eukprot:Phypoly_transcript_11568.p1 GENE.Phypoly_transcript_11568~~Phypoly_transcript_11568.p1  ORF type:complete len:291 (+),score=42.12 Phypoly_transcript_11568:185-1057(+)